MNADELRAEIDRLKVLLAIREGVKPVYNKDGVSQEDMWCVQLGMAEQFLEDLEKGSS